MFHVIDIKVEVSVPFVVTHLHWAPTFEGLGVDLSITNIQQDMCFN
jgi:hypothetical protein